MKRHILIWIGCIVLMMAFASCATKNKETKEREANAYRRVGEAHLQQGNFAAAMKEFKKAEAKNPDDHLLQYDLGLVYARLEKFDEAIVHQKKALDLSPNYGPAMNSLGNAYAGKEDWDQAIFYYNKVTKDVLYATPHIAYSNLGNAYYKTNNIGRAILYYEKARKFIEGDPALEQNLKLTQLKIVDKIEPIPELFIVEWWSKLTRVFSLETLLWFSFSIFSILITFIILQILYTRQFLRRFIWATTVLFVLIFVITFSQIYEFETWQFGVILEEKVSVVSEPGIGGTEVFILHEGTKVKVNRMLNDWLEISIPDGKTGWLRETSLEVI